MAASSRTLLQKGSDVAKDACCTICEEFDLYQGRFYCQKCSKYFCDRCMLTHNKFLKDHSVIEKRGGDNWSVNTTVDDTLELCEEHTTEKLTMFCEDDEKLLCQFCLRHNHRQCSHVLLLADKIKSATRRMDVAQMSTHIEQLLKRLEDMLQIGEQHMSSMQTSYERALQEILNARQQINDNLDRLQQTSVRNLEQFHSSLKTSLDNENKQCAEFVSKLRNYDTKSTHNTSIEQSFIMDITCLDHWASADSFLQNVTRNVEIYFERNKDLEQFLASCRELGKITSREAVSHHRVDPNEVVSITDKSQYMVRTPTDKSECNITGICESSDGELVITDFNNQCVKLLDQGYSLIEQIQLPACPWSMCNISDKQMAVTVGNVGSVNEINLLRIDKGQMKRFRTLKLNHSCFGFAIHKGDLFVTSGTALYQYTMDGRLVKKLYKNSTGLLVGVGVSPDGKSFYVTDRYNGKLLTLTNDGAVTATLQDPAFRTSNDICNIHVAATGQVFVLGDTSVSQIDTDGKKVLNTITLDTSFPRSVYWNKETSKMIVGFKGNENVIEFKTNFS